MFEEGRKQQRDTFASVDGERSVQKRFKGINTDIEEGMLGLGPSGSDSSWRRSNCDNCRLARGRGRNDTAV